MSTAKEISRLAEMNTNIDFPHVTIGSIFSVDDRYFYQVIKRSGNTIFTRQIQRKDVGVPGTGVRDYVPCKDKFITDRINRSKIKSFDVNNVVVDTTIEHGYASLWID